MPWTHSPWLVKSIHAELARRTEGRVWGDDLHPDLWAWARAAARRPDRGVDWAMEWINLGHMRPLCMHIEEE